MVVYHRNPRMHTLGNHGAGGFVHALLAPLATALITQVSYHGWEPRAWLHGRVAAHARVADFGCGVGLSTIPGGGSPSAVGVDASAEMVRLARVYRPTTEFVVGDVERWGDDDAYDAVTISFVLHEMPRRARLRTLRNAVRVSTREVVAMDICPTHEPSAAFLMGEPYFRGYAQGVDADMRRVAETTGRRLARHELVPEHVIVWVLAAPDEAEEEKESG